MNATLSEVEKYIGIISETPPQIALIVKGYEKEHLEIVLRGNKE